MIDRRRLTTAAGLALVSRSEMTAEPHLMHRITFCSRVLAQSVPWRERWQNRSEHVDGGELWLATDAIP
jgi:hypothetical protein